MVWYSLILKVGPLVTGAIRDSTGDLKNAFYFMLIFLITPSFIYYAIDETKGKIDAMNFTSCGEHYYNDEFAEEYIEMTSSQ